MKAGTVGIMPPGALGVSFFYHLTERLSQLDQRVFFVGLDQSASIESVLSGHLNIMGEGRTQQLPSQGLIFRRLDAVWEDNVLPEILIVCPNPDRLLSVISTIVNLIERICHERPDQFEMLELPAVILCSNGIYFQRVRQMFVEKLEESTLLGRLPDLWPEKMPFIVGHLLRGVTLQSGLRKGNAAKAVYYPGPRGLSILAGGDEKIRNRCCEILSRMGGWFEPAEGGTPTRLEFEKAIVNLTVNLLGLVHAFDESGRFRPLKISEIILPKHHPAIRDLAFQIFQVGRAVRAFSPETDFEQVLENALTRCRIVGSHVPSSIQRVDLQIRTGTLEAIFPPTETWLIEPLIHYARSAGLPGAVEYFETLRTTLIGKLAQAIHP